MRALLFASAAWLGPPAACAQDVHAAAAAFAEGQQAQLRGDYARAAELFEVADQAAPSPEALRSAIRNRRAADQLARAATLSLEALDRYPDDEDTRRLAEETLAEAQARLGALRVTCTPECALALDGRAAGRGTTLRLFVEPGPHRVRATWPERGEEARVIELEAGAESELALAAPEPEATEPEPDPERDREAEPTPQPPPPARRGIGPEFFGIGVAITVFGAALTTWSGVDTLSARDAYVENPTRAGYENGVALQWRTNGLLFGTLAFGAATAILALFTDFGGGALVAFAPVPGGAYAQLGGSFEAWR